MEPGPRRSAEEEPEPKRVRVGTRDAVLKAGGDDDAGAAEKLMKDKGRRLHGVVDAFNMRLGLGKIKCTESGSNVVVAVADLAGFDVGDSVTFILVKDPVL